MRFADRMELLKPSDIREVGKLILANPGTVSLAGGMPDPKFFPAKEIAEVTKRILEEEPGVALQYGPTIGRPSFREEIAKYVKNEGIDTTADSVMVTTGSQQGIYVSGMLCLNPGDTVAVETPSYLGAFSAFEPSQIEYKGVPSDDEGMDLAALEELVKSNDRVKVVYVIPNFQNPTGRTWSRERRQALVELANRYDLWILEDNAYGDLIYEGERIPSVKSMDTEGRVLYLGTFSKVLSPGLRTGFVVATEELIPKLEMIKYGVDLQSAELAQMQVEEYLRSYDLSEHVANIAAVYKERRDAMLKVIEEEFPEEATYVHPRGGMFVWVELPSYINTRELLREAVERKVAFVPGGSFYAETGQESALRLNFSMVEPERITEGMRALAALIRSKIR